MSGSESSGKVVAPRREFQVLLPVALLILIGLSTFTLFAYRSTVLLLVEENERELNRFARLIGPDFVNAVLAGTADRRQILPPGLRAVVFDEEGSVIFSDDPYRSVPSLVAEPQPGNFASSIKVEHNGRFFTLRLEQAAGRLSQSQDGLRILVPLVLVVDAAVALLILLYFRQFIMPLDRLVERAQRVRPGAPQSDEVDFLIETFDRALEALARPGDDDLLALQRTLAPSLDSGVLLCDRLGAVIALNEAGAELLGIASPEVGTPLAQALEPRTGLIEFLTEAMRERRSEQRRELTLEVDERTRALGLTVHILRRDDGEVRGFLVLFVDLTAIRKQNEERRLAEILVDLGEIAAGVAHELRNSVATLRGYLTLVERAGAAESIADYAQEIRRETEHLSRVVDDFLAFARPGTARSEELSLLDVVRRAAADPALSGVEVEVLPEANETYVVCGDSQLLERALRNLIHNAAAAERQLHPEDPRIEVAIGRRQEQVEIAIADRGPGIPPEIRPRLFRPFVSGRPDGVGLGLALTLRILHLHGGDVRLEDRRGGGTRALVTLPSAPPAAQAG